MVRYLVVPAAALIAGVFNFWPQSDEGVAEFVTHPAHEPLSVLGERLVSMEPGSHEYRQLTAKMARVKARHLEPRTENPDVLIEAFANLKTAADGTRYQPGFGQRELDAARRRAKGLADDAQPWVSRGPANVSGRVRSMLIDQADASGRTWIAAAIGGGIWKSSNAGTSWRHVSAELGTLSTTALAQSASNPAVIYAGTGMGFGRIVDLVGSGIWKSTDGGESWSQLASTANGELLEAINRIVVDPNNPDIVVVASNDGFSHLGPRGGMRRSAIFKSTDGGNSWRQVFDPETTFGPTTDNRVQQIVADPSNFSRLYATVNEVGVIRSDNAGETWAVSANNFALPADVGVPTSGGFGLAGISVRTEMAVSPNDPTRLYAAVERPRGIVDLFMSQNGGDSWVLLNDTSGDPNWFSAFSQSGAVAYTAGWFDNTIVVDPNNPNVVFVGGVNIFRIDVNPTTASRSSANIAFWIGNNAGIPVVHADQHDLHTIPALGTPYAIAVGNDGGVGFSADGGNTWRQITGMVTTQFYGVDKRAGSAEYLGGTQDNGSWRSAPNPNAQSGWTFVNGGDGFEAIWHATDPSLAIANSQFGNYVRSTDGGFNFTPVAAAKAGSNAPFISKLGYSKTDPDLVFTVGNGGVNRSDDFGATWTLTPINGNWLGYRPFDNVEVSIADPQVVWISSRLDVDPPAGVRGGIHISIDGGLSFTEVSQNFPSSVTESSGIGTHPSDPDTAYMLFAAPQSPKILRTTDRGNSWTDISGFDAGGPSTRGFPDVPVYSLIVMPFDEDILWAGTDIGLVISEDGGESWQLADNGFPNVATFQLSIVEGEILAATQGRGIWTLQLPELADYRPPTVTLPPRLSAVALRPDGTVIVRADQRSSYDTTEIRVNGEPVSVLESNVGPASRTLEFLANLEEQISVEVAAVDDGRTYRSANRTLSVYPVGELSTFSSALDANSDAGDFLAKGFSISQPNGFNNSAFHTAHPYSNAAESTLQFRDAVPLGCGATTLSFDEVAIIESGTPGVPFGQAAFWDFAVVEGSADGVNWLPVANGWDARDNQTWLNTYNSGGAGTSAMFARRTLTLDSPFDPGQPIFVRFRLFADAAVTGWGWAIDNIELDVSADDSCLVVNREGISGAWFNADRDGEGWLIEALPDGRATVYWFTYPPESGGQNWLIGTGDLSNGTIDLSGDAQFLRPVGARFGDAFDPEDVQLENWGSAQFVFSDCASGEMTYAGPDSFGSGNIQYSRLTRLGGQSCRKVGPGSIDAKLLPASQPLDGISGSWFNPAEPGHGWIIERLDNGGVLVIWFVYSPGGEQAWIIASAGADAFSEDGFTLEAALITDGTVFGPGFDPADVERIDWGTLQFNFDSCGSGTMSWNSVLEDWGSGSHPMERLSNLAGLGCESLD